MKEIVYAMHSNLDTSWFSNLSSDKYESMNKRLKQYNEQQSNLTSVIHVRNFLDSLIELDQKVRKELIPGDSISLAAMIAQDESNAKAIILFTENHGFPAGKNALWDQTIATILLHQDPKWFVENYTLLYSEIVKGNLEPWMLARGIDRMYTVDIGQDKINPYNRYWNESVIDPFLMFYNCTALGVSPYYDYNWLGRPRKTIHFEHYKANKKYYNTSFNCK